MLLHVYVVMLIHWYERKKNFFQMVLCLFAWFWLFLYFVSGLDLWNIVNTTVTEVGAYQVHLN